MAAPALLSLSPAVSRHPHLLFSHTHSPRHLRLTPLAASSSPSPSPSPAGGGGGGGVFLSPSALSQLDALAAFRYEHSFPHGNLTVRALTPADDAEADVLVRLLASSFSEDVRWAPAQRYAQLLAFLIRRYLYERRGLAPHAAVLVGFYKAAAAEEGEEGEGDGDEGEMACTAEVSLDAVGAPGAPPTPTPPLEFPYICNMTVKTSLRRPVHRPVLLPRACDRAWSCSIDKGTRSVLLHRARDELSPTASCARRARSCRTGRETSGRPQLGEDQPYDGSNARATRRWGQGRDGPNTDERSRPPPRADPPNHREAATTPGGHYRTSPRRGPRPKQRPRPAATLPASPDELQAPEPPGTHHRFHAPPASPQRQIRPDPARDRPRAPHPLRLHALARSSRCPATPPERMSPGCSTTTLKGPLFTPEAANHRHPPDLGRGRQIRRQHAPGPP